MTIEELQRQVRQLKDDKGFDITLEQRLAYLMSEVGGVASEVLELSWDGNRDAGKMSAAERLRSGEPRHGDLRRDVEPVRFGGHGGRGPGKGFREKGGFQRGQGMVGAV